MSAGECDLCLTMVDDESEWCDAGIEASTAFDGPVEKDGIINCTRPDGHDGDHVACAYPYEHDLLRWNDDGDVTGGSEA